MLKILDRYIIRKFLGTYIFSILLLLAIVIMFDINEKLDSFLEAPLKATIVDYFINFLPYFANQFAPLFTFITVIFFTSKLAGNSEIIAMRAAGMSYRRLLRPYLLSALVIAVFSFVLDAYVIPPANQKRIEYTNKYVKDKSVNHASDIMLKVSPTDIVYMSGYEKTTRTGYGFSMERYDGKKLVARTTAGTVKYLEGVNWQLLNYTKREFQDNREYIVQARDTTLEIPFRPEDFLISDADQEILTTPQLKEYIDSQIRRGVGNIQAFEVEYHRRYAMFAAAFILTVIGFSLSCRKVKGGIGLNIGIGLVLSFSYILFMRVTQTFALSGLTSAAVAMWIPNVIYAIIAIVLYRRTTMM